MSKFIEEEGFKNLFRKKYSVKEVMEKNEKRNKSPMILDGMNVTFPKKFDILVKQYKKNGEIRCPYCGTKASHFRISKSNKHRLILCCFRKIKENKTTHYTRFNIDHIVPVSKNGENKMENMQYVCKRCNELKDNHDPETVTLEVRKEKYNEFLHYINSYFKAKGVKNKYKKIMNKMMDKMKYFCTEYLKEEFKITKKYEGKIVYGLKGL